MPQDRFEEIAKVISSAGSEKEIDELFDKSADEAIAWFKSKGCEVTKEDLSAFAEKLDALMPENGELSEDALENVAGGMIIPRWWRRLPTPKIGGGSRWNHWMIL